MSVWVAGRLFKQFSFTFWLNTGNLALSMRNYLFAVLVGSLIMTGAGCASAKPEPAAVADETTIAVAMTVLESTIIPGNSKVEVGETIGCNDRVIFVNVPRKTTGDILTDALTALFAVGDNRESWQNNALSGSQLAIEKIQSRDGVTKEVWIKGTISSGGTCDDPRIKAQVEKTIARYAPKFEVYLNGTTKNWRCLGDQSGQCK